MTVAGGATEEVQLQLWGPASRTWSRHLIYTRTPEGNFATTSYIKEPGILYRSWEPLPVGSTRFRLTGKGLRTVEETLQIRAGVLTEWKPFMDTLPPGEVEER